MPFNTRTTTTLGVIGFFACIAIIQPSPARASSMTGQLDNSTSTFLTGFISDTALQPLGKGITGTINELCVDIADGRAEDNLISFHFWHQPTSDHSASFTDRTYIFTDNLFQVPPTEEIRCKTFASHAFKPDQYYFIYLAPRWPYGLIVFGSDKSNAWGDENSDMIRKTCPIDECYEGSVNVKDIYFSGIQQRDAVILVPGILGTKIDLLNENGSLNFWPAPGELKKPGDDFLSLLGLGIDGKDLPGRLFVPTEIVKDIIVANIFSENVYKDILDLFQNNSYPSGTLSFQNPYDWRLDLSTTAQGLGATIQDALAHSESGKVSIVAHSMGGLLAKEYLRTAPANIKDKIDKIIFLGTPNLGAPKAAKVLTYGDDLDIKILNTERARVITQNMPSVYELLPSRKYFSTVDNEYTILNAGTDTGPYGFNFEENKTFLSSFFGLNSKLLNRADDFHNTLDSTSIPSNINVLNIVGCNNPTLRQIVALDRNKYQTVYTAGDGTVPLGSATYGDDKNQRFYSDARHLDLVKDQEALDQLINILNDKPTENSTNFSTSTSVCNFTQQHVKFATHSPVDLHIYDDQNRHLGPSALGDIEYGIPDSSYDTIGDNHFAVVPDSAGTTYRIVIDAYASGTFDFDWTAMTGSTATAKTSYLNQPIQSASTTATFTYSASSPKPLLSIDNDGNGTIDKSVNPNATVTGTIATDITPPVITITSPYGLALFNHNESIKLAATAQDSGSGVALFETRLDGKLITSSELDLFNLKLGSHTLNYLAFDKAGNPTELEQELAIEADSASTISDVERAYALGWIKKKDIKNDLIKELKAIMKIEKKIIKLDAQLPHSPGKKASGQKITKTIEKLQSSVDKKLGKNFLAEVEKKYKKGNITLEGYTLLKEDVEWMMQ